MSPSTCKPPLVVLLGLALAILGGCVLRQAGPPEAHFEKFSTKPPIADSVTICHAYTCQQQTPYTFSRADIAEISAIMTKVKRNDSPFEERRAVAYAIAKMETDVGKKLGIKDIAGMQFTASGDPSQMDCVDEATNTTSYLLVLERNGLIKRHTVERPFGKAAFNKWPHWAALIREKESGEEFTIDASASANGENPTVQSAASFYVPDGPADNRPPETSENATPDPSWSYSGSETGSVR